VLFFGSDVVGAGPGSSRLAGSHAARDHAEYEVLSTDRRDFASGGCAAPIASNRGYPKKSKKAARLAGACSASPSSSRLSSNAKLDFVRVNCADRNPMMGVCLAAFAVAACVAAGPATGGVPTVAGPADDVRISAPADADCLAFVKRIEDCVAMGDPALLDASLQWESLLHRAVGGSQSEAAREFKQSMAGKSLAKELFKKLPGRRSYTFLRLRSEGKEKRALFRLIKDGAVNYHELLLTTGRAGLVRIADVYVYASGEWLSETLRRSYISVAAAKRASRNDLIDLAGDEVRSIPILLAMTKAVAEGRHRRVAALYDQLPEAIRRKKHYMLLRLPSAFLLDAELYRRAVAEYQEAYPDDPTLLLMEIDHASAAQKFDRVLECLDLLDKELGGDPFLDHLRCLAHIGAEDLHAGREAAKRALRREPTLEAPHWALVTISVRERDFAETIRLLSRLERELQVRIDDLRTRPEYEEFVATEEYRTWMLSRSR
jgi:hypothetical protein